MTTTPPPVPALPSILSSQLESLFVEQREIDIELEIGKGKVLGAHKCILAANSQFFASMFTGGKNRSVINVVGFQESNKKSISHDLGQRMTYEQFYSLIRYFYSGKVEFDLECAIALINEYEFCIHN